MKKFVYDVLRRISAFTQTSQESFKRHNDQYEEVGKLEAERIIGQQLIAADTLNGDEMAIGSLLSDNPAVDTVVDIGSGTGWSSAAFSPLVARVIALEPSQKAIEMSQILYPTHEYKNIEWHVGLAEDLIPQLHLTTSTLFFTGCVFSHIRDKEVIKICEAINAIASKGSVLSFAECWGDEPWHQMMWHVRTKDWWQEALPGWTLDFHGPQVPQQKYHKGIKGVKH